jgi:hypothetical protein
LPTQHVLQLLALHVGATHVCVASLHTSPSPAQLSHALPPPPHAALSTPPTHSRAPEAFFSQQPLGQFFAVQPVATPSHVWSFGSQAPKPCAVQSSHA